MHTNFSKIVNPVFKFAYQKVKNFTNILFLYIVDNLIPW